jgi:hypothetical protein
LESRRKETRVTIEEMEAEYNRMEAHLQWLRDDSIAEITEALKTERNPYMREFLVKRLEKLQATGRYD